MATQMTKSQLIEQIATKSELAKKDVKGVIETLADFAHGHCADPTHGGPAG